MMNSTKNGVIEVFDSLASRRAWEGLYSGAVDRVSYNFVTRKRAVEELLASRRYDNVLDVGCGTGDMLPFFAQRGVQYTGLDMSSKMIERASRIYALQIASNKATFMVGDSEKLPFPDEEFEAVCAVALVEYVPDASQILQEINRVLKPGAFALITVPHKSCINFKIRGTLAPLTNVLFPLYVKLKGASLTAMKDVKHYHYDPWELDALMEMKGFKKSGGKFSNFYLVPHPINHFVPGAYIRLSERIDRSARPEKWSRFAANYIGLYQKN